MKKISNLSKTKITGKNAGGFWLILWQWLWLLVLSFARIKIYLSGLFSHPPDKPDFTKKIITTTITPEPTKKLTNMKPAKLIIKWGLMLFLTACATNAIAQAPPSIPGDHSVCLNSTNEYGVVLNPGSTYAWSITPNTGFTMTPHPTYPNLITVTWTTVGAYTVQVIETNAEGCVGDPVSIMVTVNPLPTVTVNSPTVCQGTAATITAAPGEPGTYNYAWTVPAGVPDPGNVASFTSTLAGTYTVVITNTATGCISLPASGTVTVNELPVCSITGNNNICPNSTNTYSGPLGMSTYTWSISGNGTISGATNGQTVSVLANNSCGSFTLTLIITDANGCTSTCSQTFDITTPPVVLTAPADFTATSCQTQAQIDAAYASWLAGVTSSGGCTLNVTNNAPAAAPSVCGGAVTVTWTAASPCEPNVTASATFNVPAVTPVVITTPVATTVNACDFANQAALDAAFQAWLATASVTGGCAPVLTNNATGAGTLCTGGAITVTFTATDLCQSPTATATFTVTPAPAVTYNQPADANVASCTFTNQAAVDAAMAAWVTQQTTAIAAAGGCAPQVTSDFTNQSINLCAGGTVTITWTITDKCQTATVDAIYTVTPAPPVQLTCPPLQTFCVVAANYYTIPALIVTHDCSRELAIAYEVTGATTRSGSGTDASGVFNVGVSTITWSVTDACGNVSTCTTTVTLNPKPATTPITHN